ncbi:MAG: crossover junction endodeoxyribonuclease RuvC [Oscillospiraceae bacterium]|jgi:crossover junction endodeoxyribonuclease RuvC|nr:crossover junction endodeoxyribonuclease RuvC [Oscillospiraceae bacterium]
MRILGIDPGLATVGFGVVDTEKGSLVPVRHGAITTPAGVSLPLRLLSIGDDLLSLLETFQPDAAAVEELFFSKNVTTGLAVAHGRGVILMTLARRGLPVFEYKPMQVKQAVAGYGGADKRQVMEMVRQLLHLEAVPRPDDAADALALAICHAHVAGSLLGKALRDLV